MTILLFGSDRRRQHFPSGTGAVAIFSRFQENWVMAMEISLISELIPASVSIS